VRAKTIARTVTRIKTTWRVTMLTIVLVHGALADASSWNGIIKRLQGQGHTVVAPANPRSGLADDTAYIAGVVDQIEGPVLLVGHSYAGAVISNVAAKAHNVVGLVFVAAFAPDEGEWLGDVAARSKDAIMGPALLQRKYPIGRYSTPRGRRLRQEIHRQVQALGDRGRRRAQPAAGSAASVCGRDYRSRP
jgi:pimeloyl-ACP methyl ester carboxylesterase